MSLVTSGAFALAPVDYYPGVDGHDAQSLREAVSLVLEGGDTVPYTSTAFDTHDAIDILDASLEVEGSVELIYSDARATFDSWPGYNREHVWPQSLGAGVGSPAHADLHHIFACDANVNSARSNKPFGECTTDCSSHPEAPDAKYNSDVFEPPTEQKGDIARALLYMDIRYEGNNGEPDLRLTNDDVTSGCDCMGSLSTLLSWHLSDPVDSAEEARNEEVFAIQGNRNPFVDHPEWVFVLYPELTEPEAPLEQVPTAVEDEESPLEVVYLRPIAGYDGHIQERFQGSGSGGKIFHRGQGISVGDTNLNRGLRGLLAFNIETLPEGAIVESAIVHLTPIMQSQTSPFSVLGECVVELGRSQLGRAEELERADYSDESEVVRGGVVPATQGMGESVAVELSQEALLYLVHSPSVQLRLRFEESTNAGNDRNRVVFGSGEHPNMLMQPTLEIRYTNP